MVGVVPLAETPRSDVINVVLCQRATYIQIYTRQSVLLPQNGSHPQLRPRRPISTNKKTSKQEAFLFVVEVVGVEPTSYAAAKKLSTYLVYLLFLNVATRTNTLCNAQKAGYSYRYTFRYQQECSVLMTPRPRPTDKSGATFR